MQYKRVKRKGNCYFFTVNIANRNTSLLTDNIQLLRDTTKQVMHRRPFTIDAMVILPDHIHAIWTLPPGDNDYSIRWSQIKSTFSRQVPVRHDEKIDSSRAARRERGLWQRRFWEHCIRDLTDWENHVNYIHINPVKHRLVKKAYDWPYSSIHRFVREGKLSKDWAAEQSFDGVFGE